MSISMTAPATKILRTPAASTSVPLMIEQTMPPAVLMPPDQPKKVPRSSAEVVLASITCSTGCSPPAAKKVRKRDTVSISMLTENAWARVNTALEMMIGMMSFCGSYRSHNCPTTTPERTPPRAAAALIIPV